MEEKFPKIKRYIELKAKQTPQYSDIAKTGHEMGGDFIFIDYYDESKIAFNLGNKYRKLGNTEKAKRYYDKACKLQNAIACAWLGYIYGSEHKDIKAASFLIKACKYGHQKSCEIMGR